MMQWNALKSVLKGISIGTRETTMYNKIMKEQNVVAMTYNILISNEDKMFNTYVRWQVQLHTDLSYQEFLKVLSNINKIKISNKLRSFQFRVMHLALITNTKLKSWKIVDTDVCHYCKKYPETVEHLLYDCENAQNLLKNDR